MSQIHQHKSIALANTYASYVVRVHTRHGIKTLSFDNLAAFFTSTAKKAAEDLGISSRTLIRVCRSLGIRRWPYLGFRSEKNVERIRQEAIENLRRKLEKEGKASAATAVLYPNASCLRGASAKRLLQVKVPQYAQAPVVPRAPRLHVSAADMNTWCVSNPAEQLQQQDLGSVRDTDEDMDDMEDEEDFQAVPLLTPQHTQTGFNLDIATISPKKLEQPSTNAFWSPKMPAMSRVLTHPVPSSRSMPSLNLLVDASILTSMKHETQEQAQQQRTMSMRDILTHSTAMVA